MELYPIVCPWQCSFENTPGSRAWEIRIIARRLNSAWTSVIWQEILQGFKTCGPTKGGVFNHLFYPEFLLAGCSVVGGYTAYLAIPTTVHKKSLVQATWTQISAWGCQMLGPKVKQKRAGLAFDLLPLPPHGPSLCHWSLKRLCTGWPSY